MADVTYKPYFVSDGVIGGPVKAEWLSDGRSMKLLADFSFFDDQGIEWFAPAGSVVDGASIPRWLWSIIGGPFEGKYRDASVIHDVYCKTQTRPSWRVHIMFFQAMRTKKVAICKAIAMYVAVRYIGGPRFPGKLL